ncbi:MAG: hypothetical protein Fues2KO_11090 [Fuerstiella sp.]
MNKKTQWISANRVARMYEEGRFLPTDKVLSEKGKEISLSRFASMVREKKDDKATQEESGDVQAEAATSDSASMPTTDTNEEFSFVGLWDDIGNSSSDEEEYQLGMHEDDPRNHIDQPATRPEASRARPSDEDEDDAAFKSKPYRGTLIVSSICIAFGWVTAVVSAVLVCILFLYRLKNGKSDGSDDEAMFEAFFWLASGLSTVATGEILDMIRDFARNSARLMARMNDES